MKLLLKRLELLQRQHRFIITIDLKTFYILTFFCITLLQENYRSLLCNNNTNSKEAMLKNYISGKHLLVQSSNENTRERCEMCSNLSIKAPEKHH